MALPLLPLLLSTGARQLAKRSVSKGLKLADRGLTGAMIVDSVNEASKGNYEGLTSLAQASLMGRMNRVGPIRKIDDYIVTKGLDLEPGKTGYRKIVSPRKVDTSKPLFEGRTAAGTGAINRESGGSIAKPKRREDPAKKERRRIAVSEASRGGKMVPVDKDGNLANYMPASGKGGMILGQFLKDGKPTGKLDYKKDHPAYQDMIKQQQAQKLSDKRASEFNIRQSLMKRDQTTYSYEPFKKNPRDIESQINQMKDFARKRIAEYKKKGDRVNRIFTTKSTSDQKLATIMKSEANRQGVPLQIETTPSKASLTAAEKFIKKNPKYAEVGASGKSGKGTFLMDRDIQQEAMLRTMMQKKISKSGSSVGSVQYVKAESPNRTFGVVDYAGSLRSRVGDISSAIARGEGLRRQKFIKRPPEVRDPEIFASRPKFDTRLPSLMNKPKVRQDKPLGIKLDPETSTLRVESNIVPPPRRTPGKQKFGGMKRSEMTYQVQSMLKLKVNIKQGTLSKSYKPRQPDLFKK